MTSPKVVTKQHWDEHGALTHNVMYAIGAHRLTREEAQEDMRRLLMSSRTAPLEAYARFHEDVSKVMERASSPLCGPDPMWMLKQAVERLEKSLDEQESQSSKPGA